MWRPWWCHWAVSQEAKWHFYEKTFWICKDTAPFKLTNITWVIYSTIQMGSEKSIHFFLPHRILNEVPWVTSGDVGFRLSISFLNLINSAVSIQLQQPSTFAHCSRMTCVVTTIGTVNFHCKSWLPLLCLLPHPRDLRPNIHSPFCADGVYPPYCMSTSVWVCCSRCHPVLHVPGSPDESESAKRTRPDTQTDPTAPSWRKTDMFTC